MNDRFTLAVTGQSLIKYDIRTNRAPAFQEVQALLHRADLAFTNFEGTILGSHGGWPLKGSFFGCSDPVVLDALQATGFRALSLSNNHAFDLGPSGVLSTLEEVGKRAFLHAGLGRNQFEAAKAGTGTIGGRRVAIVAMDGGPGPDFMYAENADIGRPERPGVNRLRLSQVIKVDDAAFGQLRSIRESVGYTAIDLTNDSQPEDPRHVDPHEEIGIARAIFRRSETFGRGIKVDESDMSRNLEAIASAARDGCLVIAYLHHHHWASDWYQVPDWTSVVSRRCIDAGAAMFVSHGAPVLQPMEIYRRRPIFHSLGNFIFHVRSEKSTWLAPEVWESVIGVCSYGQDNDLIDINLYPIVIGGENGLKDRLLENRLVPHFATGEGAERILRRFKEQSANLGVQIELEGGIGILRI
ncbi:MULTISPECIES: CapA family protein [unclassified Rhizobium]|uniref:CapA family protein n=1 Tax=unclassified Rhizobium TaxID=2613769 RepID=UPI001ADB594E|nr:MULTISPECIES: CapA family protein [unclassified Rhizobium]MBO9101912.1 CapA family protein [Rhizobium sp. L58/93]MBO9172083.1 CapA family protein [Rhizobium sp. L245/93]QXZ88302.1 CapA family protein [Rhizobium sp. K1/93]QXZ94273.1 CapA family protein [Rhizobium sp. K15/93]QYA05638.1 CapA family protein [Rhizobium sp. B21/90]